MLPIKYYIAVCFILFGFYTAKAQENILYKRFSFQFNHLSPEQTLDSISKETGFGFAYNPSLLQGIKPVTATFNQEQLIKILEVSLNKPDLTFKQVCQYIAITRKIQAEENTILAIYTDSSEYFYIRARVADKSDKKPVPFANILLKGRNLGTISNADGYFTVKIPSGCVNDSIQISSVGYKPLTCNISQIQDNDLLYLQPNSVVLNEVVVKHYDPKELIKEAISRVGRNYGSKPQMQIGFYRETSQKNNEYVNISEAVLQIFKAGYDKDFQTDQVKIYKNRKNPLVKQMDTIMYKLQGGVFNSLIIDIAKYPANFMSEENFDLYEYKFEGVTNYDNYSVYIVSFDQKPDVAYPLYQGKLYIETKSMAFVKAEFWISPRGIDYATQVLVKKSSSKVKPKVLGANYVVNYAFAENRWQFHHVREEIQIRVRKKYSFFNSTFRSVSELVITDSDTAHVERFKYSETVKPSNIFSENSGYYDEAFWGKFNFIPPEEKLEDAYKKIRTILKRTGSL